MVVVDCEKQLILGGAEPYPMKLCAWALEVIIGPNAQSDELKEVLRLHGTQRRTNIVSSSNTATVILHTHQMSKKVPKRHRPDFSGWNVVKYTLPGDDSETDKHSSGVRMNRLL